MKLSILGIFILFVSGPAFAKDVFDIPHSYRTSESPLPADYLESLKIKDSVKDLTAAARGKFACVLVDAVRVNQKLYMQSYLLDKRSPVMQLFLNNFPEFKDRLWEGKSTGHGVIFMSDISEFLLEEKYCIKR